MFVLTILSSEDEALYLSSDELWPGNIRLLQSILWRESIDKKSFEYVYRDLSIFSRNNLLSDICNFDGMICNKEKIATVFINDVPCVPFVSFMHLPPTITYIHIEQDSMYPKRLDSRRLPSKLEVCTLNRCGILGTIDMSALPNRLKVLALYDNPIRGTVNLYSLPLNIQKIDLRQTLIEKVVYSKEYLPQLLTDAQFYNAERSITFRPLDGLTDERIVQTSS